jgi:hypothetical protein
MDQKKIDKVTNWKCPINPTGIRCYSPALGRTVYGAILWILTAI